MSPAEETRLFGERKPKRSGGRIGVFRGNLKYIYSEGACMITAVVVLSSTALRYSFCHDSFTGAFMRSSLC